MVSLFFGVGIGRDEERVCRGDWLWIWSRIEDGRMDEVMDRWVAVFYFLFSIGRTGQDRTI